MFFACMPENDTRVSCKETLLTGTLEEVLCRVQHGRSMGARLDWVCFNLRRRKTFTRLCVQPSELLKLAIRSPMTSF